MGTGKSSVAPLVAARLGWPWADLDAAVAAAAGRDIPSIFAEEGEAGFRARERRALGEAARSLPLVLALGGGTLHQAGNLELLREGFCVVVLDAPLEELRRRISQGEGRPLWSAAKRLYRQRQPGYAAAGPRVSTVGISASEAADRVLTACREACAA